MNLKKIILFSVIFLIAVLITSNSAYCQPPSPIDCDLDPSDPLCPIDGGVAFLIAAGAGVGLLRKKRKEQE